MTKIIDEIHTRRRRLRRWRQEEPTVHDDDGRSSTASGRSAPASAVEPPLLPLLYYSLEFFPPKTQAGLANLFSRMDRMIHRLQPLFVDVTWGAGGSTHHSSLQVAGHVVARQQQQHKQSEVAASTTSSCSSNVLLHLTTTGMTRADLLAVLNEAKSQHGVQNILVLRGDPPKGQQRTWKVGDSNENGYCKRAIDLVKLIREEYGDYFGIAVVRLSTGC